MKKVAATIFLVVMACIVVACNSSRVEGSESTVEAVVAEYNALVAQYNVAVAAHNDAIPAIVGANTYLEEIITDATLALNSGELPFDPQTSIALEQSISTAMAGMMTVPDLLPLKEEVIIPVDATTSEREEIEQTVIAEKDALIKISFPDTPTTPDYTVSIETIKENQIAFQNSIQGLKQVTAPSDDFVMDRLKELDTILGLAAVTKNHDPNGYLGTPGGYIGCIYFSDERVDKRGWDIEPEKYNVIDIGTIGGGSIEVYGTVEEAQTRDTYLASFDNTSLDRGTHTVVGTLIVRISSKLAHDQQIEVENQIITVLTAIQ